MTVNAKHRFECRFAGYRGAAADKAAERAIFDFARQRFTFRQGLVARVVIAWLPRLCLTALVGGLCTRLVSRLR